MDSDYEDDMRFFRKGHSCRNICSLYKAPETISPQGVVNQYRCKTCNEYLYAGGFEKINGIKSCKCCGDNLVYVNKKIIDPNSSDNDQEKKFPSLSQNVSEQRTYGELLEFIEEGMKLQANYQLVMLKFLINHKIANKGQIAEELAFYNNKDINNIEEIKEFFKVPVYDVLINKGFVKKIVTNDVTEYLINVKLDDYQPFTINDLLESKIRSYNLEHNIPENQYGDSSNVDWTKQKFLVKSLETDTKQSDLWIWSVTPDNWEIVKSKNIWGSRVPKDRIGVKVKSGDQVAFYVIGSNSFQGIFEFIGEWYDSPGETWRDDLEPDGSLRYKSQIKLKPIQLGSVNVPDLYEKMQLFIGKPQNICNLILQGGSGYPSNNSRPLLKEDFEIILQHLSQNPTISKSSDSEISKVVKECPKCYITVEGEPGPGLENRIEEVFGYRQFDPNDPLTKKPQSYCRRCRKAERESKLEVYENTQDALIEEQKPVETKTDSEQLIVFDSNENGVEIRRYQLQHKDIITKNQTLTNDELMQKFGVGNMGGIRYSRKNNLLILCSTYSNHYDDEIDEDANIIKYTGEGQIGQQELSGGNYKIANSENIPILFFKEKYQEPGARKRGALDNIYSFVGKVKYVKHYWKEEPDIHGNSRQVIKFLLEVES